MVAPGQRLKARIAHVVKFVFVCWQYVYVLKEVFCRFSSAKIVIVLRTGMTLAHGKPWTPEIWKRVIPVFVLQKYCGKKVTKGGETEVVGSGMQQMRKSTEQLGCKAFKNPCVQVSML